MVNMLTNLYIAVMLGIQRFRKEERGAVDIVAIVVMIGIAVILAVLFRKQIAALLRSLFGTITENATNAVSGSE